MRISVKGRNTPVNDELREYVEKRFSKVARQVSDLAELEIELMEEQNPSIAEREIAEGTLYLKGVTLRARESSRDLRNAIHLVADDLGRQVERHREKRVKRRLARAASPRSAPKALPDDGGLAAL